MDISTLIIYAFLAFIVLILFSNIIKIFFNIFFPASTKVEAEAPTSEVVEESPLLINLRSEIDEQVKPHLKSLEGMYKKSDSVEKTLGSFVYSIFKDKFANYVEKDEQLVEDEICKCCSEYEGAECKESFCLEASGLSCPKT